MEANGPKASDLDALITGDQIRLLFSKSPVHYAASPVNAALYAVVAWQAVDKRVLTAWIGVFVVVAMARTGLRALFWRRRPSDADALRWARGFTALAGLNGLVWGAAAFLVFPPAFVGAQMLLVLIICGMTAGSTALGASYLPAFWLFLAGEMVPLGARMFSLGQPVYLVIGMLVIVYSLSMSLLARSTGHATREAARLRFTLAALNESLEGRVAERTAELRNALMVREEFISIASHELKTPLTSLKLQLQMLDKELRRASQRTRAMTTTRFAVLSRQTSRLAVLVNTMLDVSRLASDRIALEPRPVDFAQLVRHVVDDADEELQRSGSALTLSVADSMPGEWDPLRLEQIVGNLVANAIKYGAGQPITVALQGDGDVARLSVRDRGIGIAPADLQRIFGKFERAVSAQRYGGFGLGLFVVQQLVQAMGGTVRVQSERGAGSEFTVELPRRAGERPAPA